MIPFILRWPIIASLALSTACVGFGQIDVQVMPFRIAPDLPSSDRYLGIAFSELLENALLEAPDVLLPLATDKIFPTRGALDSYLGGQNVPLRKSAVCVVTGLVQKSGNNYSVSVSVNDAPTVSISADFPSLVSFRRQTLELLNVCNVGTLPESSLWVESLPQEAAARFGALMVSALYDKNRAETGKKELRSLAEEQADSYLVGLLQLNSGDLDVPAIRTRTERLMKRHRGSSLLTIQAVVTSQPSNPFLDDVTVIWQRKGRLPLTELTPADVALNWFFIRTSEIGAASGSEADNIRKVLISQLEKLIELAAQRNDPVLAARSNAYFLACVPTTHPATREMIDSRIQQAFVQRQHIPKSNEFEKRALLLVDYYGAQQVAEKGNLDDAEKALFEARGLSHEVGDQVQLMNVHLLLGKVLSGKAQISKQKEVPSGFGSPSIFDSETTQEQFNEARIHFGQAARLAKSLGVREGEAEARLLSSRSSPSRGPNQDLVRASELYDATASLAGTADALTDLAEKSCTLQYFASAVENPQACGEALSRLEAFFPKLKAQDADWRAFALLRLAQGNLALRKNQQAENFARLAIQTPGPNNVQNAARGALVLALRRMKKPASEWLPILYELEASAAGELGVEGWVALAEKSTSDGEWSKSEARLSQAVLAHFRANMSSGNWYGIPVEVCLGYAELGRKRNQPESSFLWLARAIAPDPKRVWLALDSLAATANHSKHYEAATVAMKAGLERQISYCEWKVDWDTCLGTLRSSVSKLAAQLLQNKRFDEAVELIDGANRVAAWPNGRTHGHVGPVIRYSVQEAARKNALDHFWAQIPPGNPEEVREVLKARTLQSYQDYYSVWLKKSEEFAAKLRDWVQLASKPSAAAAGPGIEQNQPASRSRLIILELEDSIQLASEVGGNVTVSSSSLSNVDLGKLITAAWQGRQPALQALHALLLPAPMESALKKSTGEEVEWHALGRLMGIPFGSLHNGQRYFAESFTSSVHIPVLRSGRPTLPRASAQELDQQLVRAGTSAVLWSRPVGSETSAAKFLREPEEDSEASEIFGIRVDPLNLEPIKSLPDTRDPLAQSSMPSLLLVDVDSQTFDDAPEGLKNELRSSASGQPWDFSEMCASGFGDVLLSLENTTSSSPSAFLHQFAANRIAGLSRAKAVQLAQLHFLRHPDPAVSSPAYWGPRLLMTTGE